MNLEYTYHTLSNGIRVVLHRNPFLPLVCLNLAYKVGSRDEAPGRTGFAHLFEHLMFDGSAHVPRGQYDRLCEAAGGNNNAYTNEDKTNYHLVLPAHQIELGFWLESDRLAELSLTPEGLETQRSVVMEEKRQREENQPYGTYDMWLNALLFDGHPYGHSVLGSMDDLAAATFQDVLDFHGTYYKPDNVVLTVTGDFEEPRVMDLIERYFESIPPATRPIQRITAPLRALSLTEPVVLTDDVPLPAVFLGFRIAPEREPDYIAADLLTDLLGSGERSRLHHALVYQRQIASQVSAYVEPRQEDGLMVIFAIAAQGHTAADLQKAIEEEAERLLADGPSALEWDRVQRQVETSYYRSFVSLSSRAERLSHFALFFDNPGELNRLMERYEACDRDTLLRVAESVLSPSNRAILHFLPRN